MKRSNNRILTTHVGSLPRPADLLEMMEAGEGRGPIRRPTSSVCARAVAEIVNKQVELGIDVVDDGEYSKPSFVTYINERLGGFETDKTRQRSPTSGRARARRWRFPSTTTRPPMPGRRARRTWSAPGRSPTRATTSSSATSRTSRPRSAARSRKKRSCRRSRRRTSRTGTRTPTTRPTRNSCSRSPTRSREEYKAIVAAGFLVQIDDPRLVSYYALKPDVSVADCRNGRSRGSPRVNHALRDIPTEKIRFHTCYSINMGPRIHDMQLKDCVDMILKHPRRRLFVRGRQPAPRARVEGVGERRSCRRTRS